MTGPSLLGFCFPFSPQLSSFKFFHAKHAKADFHAKGTLCSDTAPHVSSYQNRNISCFYMVQRQTKPSCKPHLKPPSKIILNMAYKPFVLSKHIVKQKRKKQNETFPSLQLPPFAKRFFLDGETSFFGFRQIMSLLDAWIHEWRLVSLLDVKDTYLAIELRSCISRSCEGDFYLPVLALSRELGRSGLWSAPSSSLLSPLLSSFCPPLFSALKATPFFSLRLQDQRNSFLLVQLVDLVPFPILKQTKKIPSRISKRAEKGEVGCSFHAIKHIRQ